MPRPKIDESPSADTVREMGVLEDMYRQGALPDDSPAQLIRDKYTGKWREMRPSFSNMKPHPDLGFQSEATLRSKASSLKRSQKP